VRGASSAADEKRVVCVEWKVIKSYSTLNTSLERSRQLLEDKKWILVMILDTVENDGAHLRDESITDDCQPHSLKFAK